MEKISTFLPVCCRQDYLRKSCFKWEKERKSTEDAVKSLQVAYIFHGGWGISGEGVSGLKNSTKFKKARCDQTKGVLERGWKRRARLGRDAVFTDPTGVWGSWAESLKVFQNQFERNITRPFCSLGRGGWCILSLVIHKAFNKWIGRNMLKFLLLETGPPYLRGYLSH